MIQNTNNIAIFVRSFSKTLAWHKSGKKQFCSLIFDFSLLGYLKEGWSYRQTCWKVVRHALLWFSSYVCGVDLWNIALWKTYITSPFNYIYIYIYIYIYVCIYIAWVVRRTFICCLKFRVAANLKSKVLFSLLLELPFTKRNIFWLIKTRYSASDGKLSLF